jgi:flavin reductase (DIM6/NTAB) family NADH-FMN oxidoreductase RutF
MFRVPTRTAFHWHHLRRAYTTDSAPADALHARLRALLRETAQPVAVVTSHMPRAAPGGPAFHGATLSSFTSVALSPHPLVAFSLRVPSRMADELSALAASRAPGAHLVVNLLSAPQEPLATLFSRVDLHPRPFDDPRVAWSPSEADRLPVLHGALGALACRVVGPAMRLGEFADESAGPGSVSGVKSELFIARVLRVEDVQLPVGVDCDEEAWKLPLLYHRRGYGTIASHIPGPPPPTSTPAM